MTGPLKYHFSAIHDVAAAIKSFESHMDNSLAGLYRQLTALFADDWQGASGQACDDARQAWDKGANEVKAALGLVGIRLAEGANSLQETDTKLAAGM
ncbi:WXG100 family type VII secretion target [Dactylosporangium sp. AC04546]|uniref:WXG100 family type VII secretion target n=1 Tax=Dactylosporangium sp. AC04546 TaxID=2862460 RepID=UPI001EDCF069|nr:WXG100 family type VII secretion target [Dactylosporangium sp. AC04546]WVK80641.1 WXG100 family type VII secretion target [Dactylosporangium sp. AC04546]